MGLTTCIFVNRKKLSYVSGSSQACQTMVAASSTTGLILQDRPK